MKIPFNIPYISGKEHEYIRKTINNSQIGESYLSKCRGLIKGKWNFKEVFLTNSCTSALEICAILLDLKPGDEVIVPSYTYPSTANAFLRQGATIILADSRKDHPGIDENIIESFITEKTKAIIPVHYSGIACDMERIMDIAERKNLIVVEDAALSFDGFYRSQPLGGIGHLGCLSFHQSKNLQCGEGGAILINDERFLKRVINILEKGTNRNEFLTGKVERYEWVDIGSSFAMTELHASLLFAQLEKAEWIKEKRLSLWNYYYKSLKILEEKELLNLPNLPEYANHNAHTFYLILKNNKMARELKSFLQRKGIHATFHYSSLDNSIFWRKHYPSSERKTNSLRYNDCLLRLPLFNSMTGTEVEKVSSSILRYFNI